MKIPVCHKCRQPIRLVTEFYWTQGQKPQHQHCRSLVRVRKPLPSRLRARFNPMVETIL